jgi:GT2 family glycosyltransferase
VRGLGVRDPDRHLARKLAAFQASVTPERLSHLQRAADWRSRIEIVVPCFNHGRYLRDAFASITGQTLRAPLTVTFINDASEDDSLSAMHHLAATPRDDGIDVRILDNPTNLLQAGSINRAVETSSSELFVVLNADDMLTPDCLELTVRTYEREPDLFLLGGSSLAFDHAGALPAHERRPLDDLELERYGPRDVAGFTQPSSLNLSHSSSSFFRGAWKAVGGYWERPRRVCSHDDRDFQMRVCAVAPVGVYGQYPMEFYRVTSSTGRGTT